MFYITFEPRKNYNYKTPLRIVAYRLYVTSLLQYNLSPVYFKYLVNMFINFLLKLTNLVVISLRPHFFLL